VISTGYEEITPGTNVTTGTSGLDSSGRPYGWSPLIDRVSPLLVPTDADGVLRDSIGDAGAYEY
jgi:hypothetical protein